MKRLLMILITTILIVNASHAKSEEQKLDHLVAIVNDDVITQSELQHAVSLAKNQMAKEQMPLPKEDILRKQTLDQLINKKIQLQLAKQAGIHITEKDLDQAIEQIAERYQISLEMLYQQLAQEGLSKKDYRHEVHDQLVMQKLQQQEIVNRITITPQEINTFIQSKDWQKQSSGPKEYHLEDTLVPLSDTPSAEEISRTKEQALTVLNALNQGKKIQELISSIPSLKQEDLGWRKLDEIPSAFVPKVSQIKAHAIAGPIQTPNGFHLIRLVEDRLLDGPPTTPNQKEIEQLLLQRKFALAMQNWISKMRNQAFVQVHL